MDLNNKNTLTPCLKGCTKPVKCPGLMADGRFITNWKPRKDYNKEIMIKFNEFDEHQFRAKLLSLAPQPNIDLYSEAKKTKTDNLSPININDLSNVTKYIDDLNKYTCKPTNPIDPTLINSYFDNLIIETNKKPTQLEGYSKSKGELYFKV